MKFGEGFRGIEKFGGRKPVVFVLGAFVTGPSDVVQERLLSALIKFGVEDFGDFVLEVTFNFDWRRWRWGSVRNVARRMWLEHGNMVDGMYCTHVIWEMKSV